MKAFEVGKTYQVRSICDHDCIYRFAVTARTAKTVTLDYHGRVMTRGVKPDYDGKAETCAPFGRYSMSPVLRADKEAI